MNDIFTKEAAFCIKLEVIYVVIIIVVISIIVCCICVALIGSISHLCVAKRKLRHLELSIARLKNFEHHYSTEEFDNTDYEIITYDTAAVDQANSPNLFSLDGNLKIPATVTNDVSHNGTVVTKRNTSHCSGDVFNTSTEMITTCVSRGKSIDESITVPNEAYGVHSLLVDPIKVHDQDPTVTRFHSNKLQVERIADQPSGLPKQNGKMQRSSSETMIIKPSRSMTCYSLPSEANIFIRNDAITTPTCEQSVNSFSEIQSGDLDNGLKAPPRLEHLVAIKIPYDDNGVPVVDENTSITDVDIATEHTAINDDEAIELQGNPAYTIVDDAFDDLTSEAHLYEEIF